MGQHQCSNIIFEKLRKLSTKYQHLGIASLTHRNLRYMSKEVVNCINFTSRLTRLKQNLINFCQTTQLKY